MLSSAQHNYLRRTCQSSSWHHNCVVLAQDVAVSVVGKYRYFMHSPAEHDSVPVIVDIILVGRTKIITLHSSIWLDNRTDRRVAFRLHVPITPLVAPVAEAPGSSAAADFKTDAAIGPLCPGEGALPCSIPAALKLGISESQFFIVMGGELLSKQ